MGGSFGTGGVFSTILGTQGLGLSGSSSETTQQTRPDPLSQDVNRLRLADYRHAFDSVGGLGGALNTLGAYGYVSPETQQYLNLASAYAQQPGLTTEQYYNQALYGLDPTFSINTANNLFNRIYRPEIQNQYSLLGLGRSGAVEDASARASAQLAAPIAQQQLQNLFSLNQQLPNVDIALRGAQLGRLGQGIGFSDYSRQVGQNTAQQQLQGYLAGISGTPYTPGSSVKQQGTKDEGLLNTAFGQGVGQGVGAAAGSDVNFKENIQDFDASEVLDTLSSYTFTYKNPTEHGSGLYAGIMAQELEQTAVGRNLVIQNKDGKYIDLAKSISFLLACVVSLNTKVKELEREQL